MTGVTPVRPSASPPLRGSSAAPRARSRPRLPPRPCCPAQVLKGHDDHVITCLQFCGNRIVSGSDDNTLKVWSAVTGEVRGRCPSAGRGASSAAGRGWSWRWGDPRARGCGGWEELQVSERGFATGVFPLREIREGRSSSGFRRAGAQDHSGLWWGLRLSQRGGLPTQRLTSPRASRPCSAQCVQTLVGHTGGVWSSQMRDSVVISGSTDRTLKVWNADTGECVHTLYGHTSTVRCMHLHGNRYGRGSGLLRSRDGHVGVSKCWGPGPVCGGM